MKTISMIGVIYSDIKMTNFIRVFIFIIALSPMAISANESINNEKVTSIQNSILSPEQVVKLFYEGYLKISMKKI